MSEHPYARPATARATPPAPNPPPRTGGPQGLGDILERILDKGLVIAGDVQLNLLDIELITLKVRLLVASADTAQQMGIDWWKDDPFLSSEAARRQGEMLERENEALRQRLERLERAVAAQLPDGELESGEEEVEGEDVMSAQRPPVRRGGSRRPGHPEVLEHRPGDT